jgi:hypothetical protein
MTIALIIVAPWAEQDAINVELVARGYGPCMDTPLVGDRAAHQDAVGNLLETPTHVASHWYVAANEDTLEAIAELRPTLFANASILVRGDVPAVPEGLAVIPGDYADAKGTWNAMVGDSIVLKHKQFGSQWGWRAEMNVQSGDFEPGVRAVAIYADAAHTQYLYTTGAFVWDEAAQRWATEWNAGKPSKTDFHWAILWASVQEQKGTLAATADAAALFLKYGLPTAPPSAGTTWVDTGATVSGQAGQLYYLSATVAAIGLSAGQAIKLGTAETTFAALWAGTDNLIQINPYVVAAVGAKVWKWA